MGLLSQEEIDAILRFQKKEDGSARANIQGIESNELFAHAGGADATADVPRHPVRTVAASTNDVGSRAVMRLETGPRTRHMFTNMALKLWELSLVHGINSV